MLENTLHKIPVYTFLMKQNKLWTTVVQRQLWFRITFSTKYLNPTYTNTVKQAV